MVVNLFNQIKTDPYFNKLIGNDYLIAEYKCPVNTERFQMLCETHFIVYIIKGKKDFIAAGKKYTAVEGDALFLRNGIYTTHQYFDQDNCVLMFFMNDNFIRNFMMENSIAASGNQTGFLEDQVFRIEVGSVLKSFFESVYTYMKMSPSIPRNLVEIKFKELLFNIVLDENNRRVIQFFTSLLQANKTSLDHFMLTNFQHDLELEEFARLSGRSLSTFKRDFKELYNESPGKWLTNKRLEHARNLLMSSDLNINEVCFESGFKNSSHFNRAFKDKYQLPPKQFRSTLKA